jgi:hypothetical protein
MSERPSNPQYATPPRLTYRPPPELTSLCIRIIIVSTVAALTGFILRQNPYHGANDYSRWNTVYALVHHNSYKIDLEDWGTSEDWPTFNDEGPFLTIDKVRRDGHFYSSKPPLLPTVAAAVYKLLHVTTGTRIWYPPDTQAGRSDHIAGRAVLLVVNVLPLLFFLIYYAKLLRQLQFNEYTRLFCVCVAAGGTFLTAYCVTFTNHAVAAFLFFFATYNIIQVYFLEKPRPIHYAAAGFFAALATTFELPGAIFGLATFFLLFFKSPSNTFKYYVVPALIPIGAFFYTNYLATGGIKPYYAYFGTEYYEYKSDSHWSDPPGIDGLHQDKWTYFTHMTVGHHGIFSLTPIFVFAVIGLLIPFRRSLKLLLPIQMAALLSTIACLVWFTFYTTNYSGMSHGLRRTFWLIPLWLIAMPPVLEWLIRNAFGRALVWTCLVFSVASVGYSVRVPWGRAWIFELMWYMKWVDY